MKRWFSTYANHIYIIFFHLFLYCFHPSYRTKRSKLLENIEYCIKHCSADCSHNSQRSQRSLSLLFFIPRSSFSSTPKLIPVATSARRWTPMLSQSVSKSFAFAHPEVAPAFSSWNHYFNLNFSNQEQSLLYLVVKHLHMNLFQQFACLYKHRKQQPVSYQGPEKRSTNLNIIINERNQFKKLCHNS